MIRLFFKIKNILKFIQILDYTNYFEQIDGVYEGDIDMNYKKEGLGIFISDSGEIYIGEWTAD